MATTHSEDWFTGKGGTRLFYQGWVPDAQPRAVLLLAHGLADHSSRYQNLVNACVPAGFALFGLDHRGHGRSEGKRCYAGRFSDYVEDLDTFVDIVRAKYPALKLFMVGHSMGGTIATAYAEAHQEKLAGLLVSAPALKTGASITRRDKLLARIVSLLMPTAGVTSLDAISISRDPAVVKAYLNDPLVYTGKISARVGAELLKAIEETIPARMPEIRLPLLIMHGTADRLSDPQGSTLMFEGVSSTDKTLKHYEGFFHEIFNDPERAAVFADMREWLEAHL